MPTQEELDRKAEDVRALRETVNQTEAEREAEAAERTRQMKMERLEAEEQRLKRRIEASKSDKKPTTSAGGSEPRDMGTDEQARSTTSRPTSTGTSTPETPKE